MSISHRSQKTPERAMERAQAAWERACRAWEEATSPYSMSRAADSKGRTWRVIQRLYKEARERKTRK